MSHPLSRPLLRPALLGAASLCLLLQGLAAPAADARGTDDRGESALVRVDEPLDASARGTLDIRDKRNDQRFEVMAKKIQRDRSVELWLEDDGMMVFVGDLVRSDDSSGDLASFKYRARYRPDKNRGSLPLDAMSVTELVGRAVEIRADGEVLLTGDVPELGISPKERSDVRSRLEATDEAVALSSEAHARVRLRSKPFKDDERFEVKISDFPDVDSSNLRLFLEDPEDPGVLVDLGSFVADGQNPGEHQFRRRTRKGDPLPFGVGSVVDLYDLDVEIRDAGDGTVYFEGSTPGVTP